MRQRTHPSSPQVIAACEVIERLGGGTSADVCEALQASSKLVCNHLARAVERGMLAVNRRERPLRYSVTPGWRRHSSGIMPALEVELVAPPPKDDLPLYMTPWQQLPLTRMSARAGA
jgi:hypothetical protein